MSIAILGGGISGLSATWYLTKKYPFAKVSLFEKDPRLGGCIESVQYEGLLFEKGARVFSVSRSPSLLALIREVGLEDQILYSDPKACTRYLWHQGKLRSLGSVASQLLPQLIKEPFVSKGAFEDESIFDFATRRLGKKAAELLFDPMTLGIYGGDIHSLSLKSCYPTLFSWEQERGSILKGFFYRKKTKSEKGLFTLKRGMESLVVALAKQLPIQLHLGTEIDRIEGRTLFVKEKSWTADSVISALPVQPIARLTQTPVEIPTLSPWVVSCAFPESAFVKRGFGHLIPSVENEPLLGAVWDSRAFPSAGPVRLSAMVRNWGDCDWASGVAVSSLQRQLKIAAEPLFAKPHLAQHAIAQFTLGHEKRIFAWKTALQRKYPYLSLIGNYLQNPSVDQCIASAKKLVLSMNLF